MPSSFLMRPSTRSKASSVSARNSAITSQRPLVVWSVCTAGSPRKLRSTASARFLRPRSSSARIFPGPRAASRAARCSRRSCPRARAWRCGSGSCRARRAAALPVRPRWCARCCAGARSAGDRARPSHLPIIRGPPIDQNAIPSCHYIQNTSHIAHLARFLLAEPRWMMAGHPGQTVAGSGHEEWAVVDYIGVTDIQNLVQSMGAGVFMERLAAEIESDYRRWGEFEKSARLASHSTHGVIELMPTSDGHLYSFKYVNGHPRNTSVGLLTVMAFGVLADVDTGYPLLLSELTVTTALRTGATSALAAKWLARPDSRVMALIGNGAQSEFQAIAFCRMLGIEELRLYDVDGAASAKLEANLRSLPEFASVRIVRTRSTAEACKGADIITRSEEH